MKSCCFTGHRQLKETRELKEALYNRLVMLIEEQGVTDFIAGGAIGWDTLCARAVLYLKKTYPQIRLRLVLPCAAEEQTRLWGEKNKEQFNRIMQEADEVKCVLEHYETGCMKLRNAKMIELSECVVCFYDTNKFASGTGQTVRMARSKGLEIYNLFEFANA